MSDRAHARAPHRDIRDSTSGGSNPVPWHPNDPNRHVRPAVLALARTADKSFLDSMLDGSFTLPGDGAIDFAAMLIALKARTIVAGLQSRWSRTPPGRHPWSMPAALCI